MSRSGRRPPPGTLERAVISAVADAEWIAKSDNAGVWLLRDVAAALDLIRRQGTLAGTLAATPRDLAELAGRGVQLLRELGLTPAARHRLGLWDEQVDDAFGQILDIGRRASVGSAEE